MEFVLICSGIWSMIFALARWSLASKNRLLKVLCVINGIYLLIIGIMGAFISLNIKSMFISFCFLLFLIGVLIDVKLNTEKNTISGLAVLFSLVLMICAVGIGLFSDSNYDIIYSCAILTGCAMILLTPFDQLCKK
mgnify:CR=1 FL=1